MVERQRRLDTFAHLVSLVSFFVAFRTDSHLLVPSVLDVQAPRCTVLLLVRLVVLAAILVVVLILILKQILVVDLPHVEVAELAVGVVRPVCVLLGLLRVQLCVHLRMLLCLQA